MTQLWQRRFLCVLGTLPPLFLGVLAILLGQDSNWDLRNYHWYNGYAALTGRGLTDLLPSQTPWFYNPTLDIPFYWLGTQVTPKTLAFILGSLQGLNFPLIYLLAYRTLPVHDRWKKHVACLAVAMLGMYGGGGIALIGTCFYDNITSLGLLGSALMTVRWAGRWTTVSWSRAALMAVLCGLPAGLMMGLKLPSATFCMGLCLGFLVLGGGFVRALYLCFFFGIGVLAGLLVALGWWSAFLQESFGSPLFPYFNQIFESPLAPLSSARDTQFVPKSFNEFLTAPFRFAANPFLVGEIPWRDWRLPIWYMVTIVSVGFFVIRWRRHDDVAEESAEAVARAEATRYLIVAFAASTVLWLVGFSIYRYLIPMEMVMPLLIAVMIARWPLAPTRQGYLCVLLGVVIAVSVVPGDWGRRLSWLDHPVEVRLPPLGDTSRLMVLMAGYEPYAHLVTAFPPEIPFVRVQSNFSSPNEPKGINRLIAERVDRHKESGGLFALLIPPWQHALAAEALAAFGLGLSQKTCSTVVDRLHNDNQMDYCEVVAIKKK